MARQLVTCPVCKVDQHVYKARICVHYNGLLQCGGSKLTSRQPFVARVDPDPAYRMKPFVARVDPVGVENEAESVDQQEEMSHFKNCNFLIGEPCICDGRKTLRNCAEMIERLKQDFLSEKSNCVPSGPFSEQAFLLAIASLDAATAHMRTAEYWEARND